MINLVNVPALNANDEEATLVRWCVKDGDFVKKSQILCDLETTKAAVEIEAEHEGYVVLLSPVDAKIKVGSTICLIKSEAGLDHASVLSNLTRVDDDKSSRRWTKKAFLVARRLGIDIETVPEPESSLITEEDILRFHAAAQAVDTMSANLKPLASDDPDIERILLIGGAGGAGRLALEIIAKSPGQKAVGILDNNPASHGLFIEGVPVLGDTRRLPELQAEKTFDGVVLLFSDDVQERREQFESLVKAGIPFANIIDPTAQVRAEASIGRGNVILANCFIGLGVTLGDNNFFANGTTIEHHSTIGSHNAFGPRTTTSGRVQVGDCVKFGMFVAVEPYLKIGSHCTIASGSIITSSVPDKTAVKSRATLVSRSN